MTKAIKKLGPIDKGQKCFNVIVETPKGSRVKYSYDLESGFFLLSKALPEGMVFPFNFGFIPQTLAEDGDPLDVLVLNEEPVISGCLLKVRPIAVLKATQTEEAKTVRNDRIIGQAIAKETPLEFQQLELDKPIAKQIEIFFATYNKVYGKVFKVLETGGPKKAWKIVHDAIELQARKHKE